MEVAGLILGTVSLVGLAGLLTSCIQLADQISGATNFEQDSDLLERKWSANRHLLKQWARMVGVQDGKIIPEHDKYLDEQDIRDQVLSILVGIESLLRDHEKLSNKYGLKVLRGKVLRGNSSQETENRQSSPSAALNRRSRWKRRIWWSVRDKAKFEVLVKDLSFFVKKLFLIIRPPDEIIRLPDELAEHICREHSVRFTGELQRQYEHLKDFISEVMGKLEQPGENICHGMEKLFQYETEQRTLLGQLDSIERVQILQWLNATFTDNEFDAAFRARCTGTCEWFIERIEFQRWVGNIPASTDQSEKRDQSMPGLWMFGNAGSGKTFISARAVEYFKVSSALPFAYFFCAFDRESKSPGSILRSWIAQIAMSRLDALKAVQDFRKGRETRPPTLSELWGIYSRIIKDVHYCRFLVDGLDECSRSECAQADYVEDLRSEFLDTLVKRTRRTTAKFAVMSRDVSWIRSSLADLGDDVVALPLKPEDTLHDLQIYAKAAVDKQLGKKNNAIKETVTRKLASKADGMFLWVRLELPRLKPRMSLEQLDAILESMPTGTKPLQRAYGRCLQEIADQQEPSDVRRAFDVLRWTLYSLVPLDVTELMEVLDYSENRDSSSLCDYDEAAVTNFKDEVLYICQPLLRFVTAAEYGKEKVLYEQSAFFRLTHFSVKEYLIGPGVHGLNDDRWLSFDDQVQNHRYCADLCASYLSQSDFSNHDSSLLRKLKSYSHRFMEYASYYGVQHAKLGDSAYDLFKHLFLDGGLTENFDLWTIFWSKARKGHDLELTIKTATRQWYGIRKQAIPPLWFAALLGLADVVEDLLERGHDPDECAEVYLMGRDVVFARATILFAAITGGDTTTVKLLLRSDCKRNIESPCCTYAGTTTTKLFGTSAERDYRKIPFKIHTNPLGIAIHFRNVEMARLLLDFGVDVNRMVKNRHSPLQQAAVQAAEGEGSKPMIRLLVEYGADVSTIPAYSGTKDPAAMNIDVLIFLANSIREWIPAKYDHGFDSEDNSRSIQYSSSDLQSNPLAIQPANIDNVPILSVVNVGFSRRKAADGCTPLHYSCRLLRYASSGFSQVQHYVTAGADVNTYSQGGTPLEFLVAQREHPDHIAYLLDKGANPQLLSSQCISSLTWKPYSRFIFSSNHPAGSCWLEIPASETNRPRWDAQALDQVKALLQAHGLDHPEVYFDSSNWTPPDTVAAVTQSLISERQAIRRKLIESV